MVSLQQSVLILAALAAFVSSAYAINCYQCESVSNEKCGEQFNPEGVHKAECSRVPVPRFLQNLIPISNATGCMKTVNEDFGFFDATDVVVGEDGDNDDDDDRNLNWFGSINRN